MSSPDPSDTPEPQATPAVPIWNCDFSGEGLSSLTVGAKFALKCHGEIPVEWKKDAPLQLSFQKPEDQYALAILQVQKLEPQDAEFVVTGYKAGDHKPEYIRFMQGTVGFESSKPHWEIKSVLKPNEKPNMYGPFGPYTLPLPLWIVFTVIFVVVTLIFVIVNRVRKAAQRRRMLEDLKRHRTAMPPLHQFYRDARTLRRRIHAANAGEELKAITEDMNREFRLYILRQFEIPTLDWTDSAILKDMRQRHRPIWQATADPLRKTLRELMRLRDQPTIVLADVEQLHRMSLDTAERLQRAREEAGR